MHALTLSALIVTTGCANYQAGALSMLPIESIESKHDENVSVSWKVFNERDCQTYLGRDVLSEGYIPLQLTIRNNSTEPVHLSPNNFSVPLASTHDVANRVHTSTEGRVLAWGISGLFFFPLLIPAFVDGLGSLRANKALNADYARKGLREEIIQPRGTFNGVVFVSKEYAGEMMEMFLVGQETNEKVGVERISLYQR